MTKEEFKEYLGFFWLVAGIGIVGVIVCVISLGGWDSSNAFLNISAIIGAVGLLEAIASGVAYRALYGDSKKDA